MTYTPKTHLSEDEKAYILKKANKIPTNDIAVYIGCTPGAIRYFLHKQGIKCAFVRLWSVANNEKLISLCTGEYTLKEIAQKMRMPREKVKNRINYLRAKRGMDLPFKKMKE